MTRLSLSVLSTTSSRSLEENAPPIKAHVWVNTAMGGKTQNTDQNHKNRRTPSKASKQDKTAKKQQQNSSPKKQRKPKTHPRTPKNRKPTTNKSQQNEPKSKNQKPKNLKQTGRKAPKASFAGGPRCAGPGWWSPSFVLLALEELFGDLRDACTEAIFCVFLLGKAWGWGWVGGRNGEKHGLFGSFIFWVFVVGVILAVCLFVGWVGGWFQTPLGFTKSGLESLPGAPIKLPIGVVRTTTPPGPP